MVNVGKYTSPMDPMGLFLGTVFFLGSSHTTEPEGGSVDAMMSITNQTVDGSEIRDSLISWGW